MVKISIVITTHNRDKELKETLESLADCTVPNCLIKVIVIENGYKANAQKICNELAIDIPVFYYYLEEPGTSNARRYSLRLVDKNEFIIFFDDDIKVDTRILQEYHIAFEKFGMGYFYGGPVYPQYETPPRFRYMELFPYSVKGFVPFGEITISDEILFLGANMAACSSDILSVGNFNPDLGPGGSSGAGGHEYDLQERLLKAGLSGVYLPDARVWHFVPQEAVTFHWLKRRYYKQGLGLGLKLGKERYESYWGKVPRWFVRESVNSFYVPLLYTLRPRRDFDYFSKKLQFFKNLGVLASFIKKSG